MFLNQAVLTVLISGMDFVIYDRIDYICPQIRSDLYFYLAIYSLWSIIIKNDSVLAGWIIDVEVLF